METFYSIQGEGFYQGHAAFFIRIAGCDVGCVWCDVKESWDAGQHKVRTVNELADEVLASGASMVIITGGEPLMYDCGPLTMALREAGLRVHLESSGAYPLSGQWDWICISPKKFKKALPETVREANELKVVIYHSSDFDWAVQHAAMVGPGCELFLQPEWSKEKSLLPSITAFIRAHAEWKLSLQIHKYIGVR